MSVFLIYQLLINYQKTYKVLIKTMPRLSDIENQDQNYHYQN